MMVHLWQASLTACLPNESRSGLQMILPADVKTAHEHVTTPLCRYMKSMHAHTGMECVSDVTVYICRRVCLHVQGAQIHLAGIRPRSVVLASYRPV